MTGALDQIRFATNGEARLAYALMGPTDPQAPTLCMIASTGRGPEDFAHLAAKLAETGYRVVLPWPRSLGQSTGPLEDITFHDLAADAAAVLKAEAGPGGAVIVGHAYGCWIARTVAQNHADLIDAVILLAAGAGTWPEKLSRSIEVAMDPDEPEEVRIAALQMAFFIPGNDPRPWLQGWSRKLMLAQRAARANTDRDSWWPSGSAPILDVIGLQDPFRPDGSLEFYLKEYAPRVTLKTIDGASHALPDEQPDQVARVMDIWLKDTINRAQP